MRHSEFLEEIEVYEQTAESFQFDNPNIEVFKDFVIHLDTTNKRLTLKGEMFHILKCLVFHISVYL